ncbi:MAG: hydrogen peroxide-inducible genes activator [Cyclobacteriaceae bacterium]|nr:hydrogen peroxide-inducible genes activator [Cyclobacteriaceae bacterium]
MTLVQLEYALNVLKTGSFQRAADNLHISQPALSMQIRKLEEEVGIRLFNRSSNPIKPTTDGELFLERAQEITKGAKQLSAFFQNLGSSYSGILRIGIIPTLAPFLVPLFADQLQQKYREFKMDIHELITEKIVDGVRAGDLDVGIISTPIHVYGINSITLFYEKFYFYTTEKGVKSKIEIDLNEINYKKLWLLEEGNCFRDQINNFCDLIKIRKNKDFDYRSNSIDALIRIVDSKGGITILPELSTLCLSAAQEDNVRIIHGKPKAREISMIVTKTHDKERLTEKLKEYIQSNIPKSMLSSAGLEIVDPEINPGYS